MIHPLPERFGSNSHIVYEMKQQLNVADQSNIRFKSDNSSIFPPNALEIVKNRMKRRISATDKIPQVLHIETAIFVDKDLYRHMATNFANDTESQIIRFVLALINGVIGLSQMVYR